jgi:hypothetical protein
MVKDVAVNNMFAWGGRHSHERPRIRRLSDSWGQDKANWDDAGS